MLLILLLRSHWLPRIQRLNLLSRLSLFSRLVEMPHLKMEETSRQPANSSGEVIMMEMMSWTRHPLDSCVFQMEFIPFSKPKNNSREIPFKMKMDYSFTRFWSQEKMEIDFMVHVFFVRREMKGQERLPFKPIAS